MLQKNEAGMDVSAQNATEKRRGGGGGGAVQLKTLQRNQIEVKLQWDALRDNENRKTGQSNSKLYTSQRNKFNR